MSLGIHLGGDPAWQAAANKLRNKYAAGHEAASRRASAFAGVYRQCRGSMVVDVIASRQRRYESRVFGQIVPAYEAAAPSPSLSELAGNPPRQLPLRPGEAETMSEVARGLLNFAQHLGLPTNDEDALCLAWAESVGPIRLAPALDPYVGSVKGVGIALLAYLRMRSGASAIKPDSRVGNQLKLLETPLPVRPGGTEILLAAEALGELTGIDLLVLDQLLW